MALTQSCSKKKKKNLQQKKQKHLAEWQEVASAPLKITIAPYCFSPQQLPNQPEL